MQNFYFVVFVRHHVTSSTLSVWFTSCDTSVNCCFGVILLFFRRQLWDWWFMATLALFGLLVMSVDEWLTLVLIRLLLSAVRVSSSNSRPNANGLNETWSRVGGRFRLHDYTISRHYPILSLADLHNLLSVRVRHRWSRSASPGQIN